MQKVYLLLRSNKQTGPYSLEEILQLNLKPFDLVWVDGRSAAWQYPSEIAALKPYVSETPQAEAPFKPVETAAMEENVSPASRIDVVSEPQNPKPQKTEIPKRVFVSVPKSVISSDEHKTASSQTSFDEHKEYMPPVEEPAYETKEEIESTTRSYSHSYEQPKIANEGAIRTNYSRPVQEVEEDYTNWVYKQKTKKKSSVHPKDVVLAVLVLAIIGGGYYVMSRPSVVNSVLPTNKTAAQSRPQPEGKVSEQTKQNEILSQEQKADTHSNSEINTIQTNQSKNIKTKNRAIVSPGQTNSSVPESQNSIPIEKTHTNIQNDNEPTVKQSTERQQPKQTLPTDKKKKLGEVLKGIFSKKEKKEESQNDAPVVEDPKPANNRQATKRDETDAPDNHSSAADISSATLMEQVDLSSNAPENWMMGVKNLKITLKNRSNVTIQAASVAVSYYNENNELLEKKLIYFSNVAPKSKATVGAPDHKFADHVDFKLTTITPKEDRYARY